MRNGTMRFFMSNFSGWLFFEGKLIASFSRAGTFIGIAHNSEHRARLNAKIIDKFSVEKWKTHTHTKEKLVVVGAAAAINTFNFRT